MTNLSPEFPISEVYSQGATTLERFVEGVGSVSNPEAVKLRVGRPSPDESDDGTAYLRRNYGKVEIARFLNDDHGPAEDMASPQLYIGLGEGDADSPDLDLLIRYEGVHVGSVALSAFNNEDEDSTLRGALAGQLIPKDFILSKDTPEGDEVLLEGAFGGNAEQWTEDKAVATARAMIKIAFEEMQKFDADALDRTAIVNGRQAESTIPYGIVQ